MGRCVSRGLSRVSLLHNNDTKCDCSIIAILLSILYALISRQIYTTVTTHILTAYFAVTSMILCDIKDFLRCLDMSNALYNSALLLHHPSVVLDSTSIAWSLSKSSISLL